MFGFLYSYAHFLYKNNIIIIEKFNSFYILMCKLLILLAYLQPHMMHQFMQWSGDSLQQK